MSTTQQDWKDTQYYEVRNILCNIWMTMIFGPTESNWPLQDEITLDVVQAAWNFKHHGRYNGNEKLLNLLDRIHREV